MVNPLRQAIIDRLWRGQDPFLQAPVNLVEFDLQGWNSQHPYLAEGIAMLRPPIVVEIGVWKGGSTVYMAERIVEAQLNSVVVAVDTWLGSSEHWLADLYFTQMSFANGYPALYHKFAANVKRVGVTEHVVPLPLDSINAAQVLRGHGILPTMIHLDGAHDTSSVLADLQTWWPLLTPGGLLVGDDYYTDGQWATVREAFDTFFGPLGLAPLEHTAGKCRVRKPG